MADKIHPLNRGFPRGGFIPNIKLQIERPVLPVCLLRALDRLGVCNFCNPLPAGQTADEFLRSRPYFSKIRAA